LTTGKPGQSDFETWVRDRAVSGRNPLLRRQIKRNQDQRWKCLAKHIPVRISLAVDLQFQRMMFLNMLVLATVLLTLASVGSFCVFKPHKIVNWGQKLSRQSGFFRINPFLFKPWYPTYLRVIRLFVLLCLLAVTGHGF
jgi:hypothetical protein